MPETRFVDFLSASFAALQREVPGIYRLMCRTLCPREVTVCVDGEVVPVRFDADRAVILPQPARPLIEVQTSTEGILDLVDAHTTLFGAIMDDRLLLLGGTEDLLCFHDGLMAYLHGAIRAPSFPDLLRRFRRRATAVPTGLPRVAPGHEWQPVSKEDA